MLKTRSTSGGVDKQTESIIQVLAILRDGRMSFLDLILKVMDPSEGQFATYRDRVYGNPSDLTPGKLEKLLDLICNDPRGQARVFRWMQPHVITSITKTIYDEMDYVKAALRITLDSITPDFLTSWDMNSFMSANVDPESPILCQILGAAMQTERGAKENKIKDGSTACHAVVTQLAKQRSNQSNYFTAPFTLSLWTSGASRQTIEALHRCGLCISFPSLLNLINNLAKHCLERV
ncbi:hypothetical protein PAXRUDRAFT_668645 [Paxillus rubicundulus Ve08.2h10]|uniref:Uncharacterized protein n=1 Tax=Paxillus rubicundulus Ve08.2h10 TaxID=930991 RepID=A0A0D0D2E3_9AGAM|nr:hypothetical protein PAXRUDRAFT_668645 [Paxillus rubicundulus Ve08.2h10]